MSVRRCVRRYKSWLASRVACVWGPAGKGREAGPEDHSGIGEVGICDDAGGDQMLDTVDQRLDEAGGKLCRRRSGRALLRLAGGPGKETRAGLLSRVAPFHPGPPATRRLHPPPPRFAGGDGDGGGGRVGALPRGPPACGGSDRPPDGLCGVWAGWGALEVSFLSQHPGLKVDAVNVLRCRAWLLERYSSIGAQGQMTERPMKCLEAVELQGIVPKAWVMEVTAMAVYTTPEQPFL